RVPAVDRSRARRDDAVGQSAGLRPARRTTARRTQQRQTPGFQARRYVLGLVVDAGAESPDEELPESDLPPDPASALVDPESLFADPDSPLSFFSCFSDEPDFSDEPGCPPSEEDFFA